MKIALLLLPLGIGCTKAGSDSGSADEITGPSHTIWSGWNHTWGMLSHRVSLIEVQTGMPASARSGILGGDWSTGDTWSDDVNHRIHQQHVIGDQISAETGSVTFTASSDGGEGNFTLETPDPDLIVLQGFRINTDTDQPEGYPDDYDPALGYTSRGFAIGVNHTDTSNVQASATVRWGPRDRDDMNRALAIAHTEVTVYFTALYGLTDIDTATYTGNQDLAHDPPNSTQEPLVQSLDWDGFGVAAIQSFDLGLHDTDGGDGGDYLRSFGVEMAPGDSGRPPEGVSTEILTYSALELGTMSMSAQADLVWLALDPDRNRIESETVSGNHPVGSHIVPYESAD